MSVACIIIAGGKRTTLLDEHILPSMLGKLFLEVVVVGSYHPGMGYRHVPVPDMMANTNDCLIKRDVGTMVTRADWLLFLSDDHAIRRMGFEPEDPSVIGVPHRTCLKDGQRISLNMGLDPRDQNAPYCAGHAGLFHRDLIHKFPWTSQSHDRLWDLLSSRALVQAGAHLQFLPSWEIEDLTPETQPWR